MEAMVPWESAVEGRHAGMDVIRSWGFLSMDDGIKGTGHQRYIWNLYLTFSNHRENTSINSKNHKLYLHTI
jgi:hypothetical protein